MRFGQRANPTRAITGREEVSTDPPLRRLSRPEPAVLETVTQRRLPDLIAERILTAIRAGDLVPGQRLPSETELARQLGVGRTSVREALRQLQTIGAVTAAKGSGTFVTGSGDGDARAVFARWSAEDGIDMAHLAEVRIAVESAAAGLAAARGARSAIRAVAREHRRHAEAAAEEDLEAMVAADHAFHQAIVEASGNPLLDRLYGMLLPELHEFRRSTLPLPGAAARSVRGHEVIVTALEAGDPGAARVAAADHLWVLYEEVTAAAPPATRRRLAPRPSFG